MSFLTHLIQHFRNVVLVQPQPVDTNKRVAGRDKANALLLKLRSRFRDRWLMTLKFLLSLIQISLWIWWKIFHVFANILFRRLRYCLSLSQSLSQFSQVDVSVIPPYWSVKRQTAKLVLWQEEMRGGFHRSNRINEARFTVRGGIQNEGIPCQRVLAHITLSLSQCSQLRLSPFSNELGPELRPEYLHLPRKFWGFASYNNRLFDITHKGGVHLLLYCIKRYLSSLKLLN